MTNWKIIGFFFAGTIFFLLILQWQGRQLITPFSPAGILSLEFSYARAHTQTIADAWKTSLRGVFRVNMLLDFLFIPFYGLFLYSTCGYFSVHHQRGWVQRLGVLLAFGSLIAMLLDIIENIFMIFSIHFTTTTLTSLFTTVMATLKFLLIGLAIVYIILSAVFTLLQGKKRNAHP